ncbi:glycosyltransferase [Synoicihabitans lomoniglobus]|uniref:Glycosyltransferase n=1 Tax=Synoicihabitans lomoniglobus TaxID=2909285 RepID=A0AAF0CPH0_9BACT|nr:glycosyltransferase [Opitutaceae bacterium LMO-M01]WED64699.1 glycosyltransferase [Opitutaceae bacterium LMO-M01]
MKICFFTNTFLPHVGGVARSTQTFLEDYRRMRHRTLVVAPEFAEGSAPRRIERSVERVPALQNFNGSDFSVRLPLGAALSDRLGKFKADIIHAHHPFLLGDTALRVGAERGVPVVFTHHTLYEQYTHYVPLDSPALKNFVSDLSTRFANCCSGVIAPSESIAELITARGVERPIRVIPTGIDTKMFESGRRDRWRRHFNLRDDDVVIGHVGRLAPEKNLPFLADALARCLRRHENAHAMIVGDGPSRAEMDRIFGDARVLHRVHFLGQRTGRALHDAYAAMDGFAFASHSETQGMVLAEAMAASNPVIALDAPGVREVVRDNANGRLLHGDATPEACARALSQLVRNHDARQRWTAQARQDAAAFDRKVSARDALAFYEEMIAAHDHAPSDSFADRWARLVDRISIETQLVADKVGAAAGALSHSFLGAPSSAATS